MKILLDTNTENALKRLVWCEQHSHYADDFLDCLECSIGLDIAREVYRKFCTESVHPK
jgi:hypothetical protein